MYTLMPEQNRSIHNFAMKHKCYFFFFIIYRYNHGALDRIECSSRTTTLQFCMLQVRWNVLQDTKQIGWMWAFLITCWALPNRYFSLGWWDLKRIAMYMYFTPHGGKINYLEHRWNQKSQIAFYFEINFSINAFFVALNLVILSRKNRNSIDF